MELRRDTIYSVRAPDARFTPVDECIYCRRPCEQKELTDEHVVPDGLNGHLILPKSSCVNCQRHINDFEFQAMRYSLNLGRAKYGVRSKKRRRRGLEKVTASGNGVDSFPIATDMPSLIAISHYNRRADVLTGETGDGLAATSLGWSQNVPTAPTLGVKVRPGDMTRFAAKIAHAYSVAVLGLNSFTPFLLDHILGSGDVGIPAFLGIVPTNVRDQAAILEIGLEVKTVSAYLLPQMPSLLRRLVIVNLHFFPLNYNLQTYEIVTGELDASLPAAS